MSFEDKKHIGDQFLRSVDSIGANIAEGYGRFHYLDKVRFYHNARGSHFEAFIHWLELLQEREKISNDEFETINGKALILQVKLNNFITITTKKEEKIMTSPDNQNHNKSVGTITKSIPIYSYIYRNALNFTVFLFISIYFNIFQCITANAQPDSLYHYLGIAAKNNPTVLQKFAEYQAALQKIPQVGGLPDPELNLGVFLSPMEQLGGNQVADIRLMQMFPWFGVLKNAKDEMSLMAKAKFELFRDAKLQVFFDVQRTWYDLHKVQQNIRISEKNIEILHTVERLAIVRFKAAPAGGGTSAAGRTSSITATPSTSSGSSGMNTMGGNSGAAISNQSGSPMPGSPMGSSSGSSGLSDVYRIQIEMGELHNNIELLKNQRNTITAQFNSYLNRLPGTVVTLPDTLIADNFQPSFPAISDSILSNNPMLGMLQLEQKSLEARKQMVTKMSYPMVGLGLNYSLINKSEMSTSPMNGKDMIMPMVTVTLPIYRKKYKAMQTEADFLKSANLQNYKATANSLQTEYYQAMQLYQDAQRRTKLYADQYRLATKSLDILFKSFASSSTDLTDILRVRQQTFDYEYKQTEAVADFNTSIAWMKRLGNIESH